MYSKYGIAFLLCLGTLFEVGLFKWLGKDRNCVCEKPWKHREKCNNTDSIRPLPFCFAGRFCSCAKAAAAHGFLRGLRLCERSYIENKTAGICKFAAEVKTTGLAGGLHWPYKGLIQLRLKTHERFANRKIFTGCPLPGAAYYLPLTTGSPVNGSLNSLIHIWSLAMSSWSWLRTYSFIVFSLRPTVST